jgi:hypothetical protein
MDDEDEDDDNESSHTNWLSPADSGQSAGTVITCLPGTSGCNTEITACKVDGLNFFPMTQIQSEKVNWYAVLKLGTTCPNGSTSFERYIDNEDDGNTNSFSGDIAPNISNGNTRLKFCWFTAGLTKMTSFPSLGTHYAVFHKFDGGQPAWVREKRFAYSDDEDDSNADSFSSATFPVWGSSNTRFDMARVR